LVTVETYRKISKKTKGVTVNGVNMSVEESEEVK